MNNGIFCDLRLQHFLCGNFLGHFDDHHESPPVPWREEIYILVAMSRCIVFYLFVLYLLNPLLCSNASLILDV